MKSHITQIDALINNAIDLIKAHSGTQHLLLCEELRYVQEKIEERSYPKTYDDLPGMSYAKKYITDPIALDAIHEVNKWYKHIYCRKGL